MSKRVNKREFRRAVLDRVCPFCDKRDAEQFVFDNDADRLEVSCQQCTVYWVPKYTVRFSILPIEDFDDTFRLLGIQETLVE